MHANILRTTLAQRPASLALRLAAARPALASPPALLSRKYLSTNNGAPSLQSNRTGDKPGVEGLHQRVLLSFLRHPFPHGIDVFPCAADDNKTVPTPPPDQAHELLPASSVIRGDWVLFHPVYTPEELKAVEVGGVLSSSPARYR